MVWVCLIILLALLEYSLFGALVSRARGRFGIKAPATTGHPEFERYFRVQQNTLESLIILIPAMLIFAWYLSAIGSAVLGLVFVVARGFYAYTYVREPASRHYPAVISGAVTLILLLGGLVGVGLKLI
ncbi:MAG: MAPEG family protein [Gammaproteobacteria bacterium]